MPRVDLNEKTIAVYDFIDRFIVEHGFPPTIRDICDGMEFSSTNGARYHLNILGRGGYLRRDAKISRGIELLRSPRDERPVIAGHVAERSPRVGIPPRPERAEGIPILGRVAAGAPIEAIEHIEGHLTLDEIFPARDDLFALRVKGESMRDRGILDGDVVVVRKQEYAREGDPVVALIGEEATVKTYRVGREAVELVPANPDFPVQRYGPADDFRILGIVIGLVRPPVARRSTTR